MLEVIEEKGHCKDCKLLDRKHMMTFKKGGPLEKEQIRHGLCRPRTNRERSPAYKWNNDQCDILDGNGKSMFSPMRKEE